LDGRSIEPVSLDGRFVRMEPLSLGHAPGLLDAGDDATFDYMPGRPLTWDLAGMRRYIEELLSNERHLALVLIDKSTDAPIGTSSYADIRPEHRGLEIGYTWIGPAYRGGVANAEMKRLMLAHALDTDVFEPGPAIRVMLKTDDLNIRSQRAMEKLGAQREGVMRNHLIMPSGRVRHSAIYSITIEDWPGVRDRLDERISIATSLWPARPE